MFSRRRQLIPILAAIALMVTCILIGKSSFGNLDGASNHGFINQNSENQQQFDLGKIEVIKDKLTLKKKVYRSGEFLHSQDLTGSVFDVKGIQSNIVSNITTELIYSFSPAAEENFASKLVDPNHEQKVYANSPAMIWNGDQFVVVMRMWLDKEVTYKKTQNTFSDNYFYIRTFSESMEPLDASGRVFGIPTRVHESIGDGPIEPRAFPFHGHFYLSFNSALKYNNKLVDTTMFWDYEKDKFVMPEITDGQPQLAMKRSMPRDKHWSPYTTPDGFYMIYSLDPLRIIKCNSDAQCKFTQNAAPSNYTFQDTFDCLRGGTPTVHYKDNYYITIAHTTLFRTKPLWKRYYTINLVVLKVGVAAHQIVYLSEAINMDPKLMSSIPMVRSEFIMDPFLFPVSLLLEDDDSAIIGGHINDHSSYLFRLRGLAHLMKKIMQSSDKLAPIGPGVGFLQKLAKQMATTQSGLEFM